MHKSMCRQDINRHILMLLMADLITEKYGIRLKSITHLLSMTQIKFYDI